MRGKAPAAGSRLTILLCVLCLLLVTGCAKQEPQPVPPPAESPAAPIRDAAPLENRVKPRTTNIAGNTFNYCANGSADLVAQQATRVLFVVHGYGGGACEFAELALRTMPAQQQATTLVVAPGFIWLQQPKRGELRWGAVNWAQGDPANDTQVSSFAVLEQLTERIALPRVVAGFSGGAQFTTRYAAASAHDAERFVVGDPSSYLYFDAYRPDVSAAELAACPSYHQWRYGTDKLTGFAAKVGANTMRERYGERTVWYLIGLKDNDPRSPSMDQSCAAMVQGSNRVERAMRYYGYLETVYGKDVYQRHTQHRVPGATHSLQQLFDSPEGRAALHG
ncbi:hypothetical protein [Granulicoccus phenolivorans]|uniref:hypothetical protein n=1 Tax=Granulicoccus phenolivorans TaxID=266854 RepID=UPI000767D6F9|nr:hypothetical protein [Granulicoccus phenolivorans]